MTSGGLGLSSGLSQDINLEELDFSDLFLYNPPGEDFPVGCVKDDRGVAPHNDNQPPLLVVDTAYICTSGQPPSAQSPSSHSPTAENPTTRPATIPAPSPRIEITPSGPSLSAHSLEPGPASKSYRECVSPASSNSSTGWSVDVCSPLASPCVSPSNGGGCSAELSTLDLCPVLQGIQTSSPGTSPQSSAADDAYLLPRHQRAASPHLHQRSRSASPQGKRSYEQGLGCQGGTPVKQRSRSPSPIPSPRQQQGSYYLQQYQACGLDLEGVLSSLTAALPRATASGGGAHGPLQRQDCLYGEGYNWAPEPERVSRAGTEVKSETCYMIPAGWAPPTVHHAVLSGVSIAPLPSLEWPLPSQSGQYELLIQKQPRSHHRAQYETEGSRGAIKTPNGGHPEVQLRGYQGSAPVGLQVFIGTADERILKPHAFYQINRITGKTVTTPSMERMLNGTKVLEIPLEPNNGMSVVIDCVGILKLRNADIELRNGETDIGRKNTRVRLVFRVHIPQPGGQLVSLQAASHPIECSQRSAQELPAVERQSLDRCSVLGGQQMVLTGQNFTSDSRVIFSEKTQDGKQIWEVEATVDRDKTQANMLFVEVPPYQKRTICHPAKVNFYVVNGKKKCSQPQHFTYTPTTAIKVEPLDEFHLNSYGYSDFHSLSALSMKSLYHPLEPEGNLHTLGVSPTLYHYAGDDLRGHVLTSDPLPDQPLYYQPRAGALINSPMPCHAAAVPHYNVATTAALLAASLTGPQPADAAPAAHCVSARTPAAQQSEGPLLADSYEACLMTRNFVQATLPLGKSPPPPRYIQGPGHPQGKPPGPGGAGRGGHAAQAPERVTVKQENLSCAYLEDVNDIIRRDLKGQSGDPGGLQQPWALSDSEPKQ